MKWSKAMLAMWLGLMLPHFAAAADSPLRLHLMTELSVPVSMLVDGHVVGSGADKVTDIMQRTGTAFDMELLPWKRAYMALQERPDACLFPTTRTPEREALFQWAGPIDEADWLLLGRADRHYDLRTLEQARKLRIGTYSGDARDTYLRQRGFLVDPAPNDMLNPDKLLLDRIDLWAASLRHGNPGLQRFAWSDKIVPVLVFNRVSLYVACNRAVPASLIARMNTAVEAMNRDGAMRRIELKYEKQADPLPGKP